MPTRNSTTSRDYSTRIIAELGLAQRHTLVGRIPNWQGPEPERVPPEQWLLVTCWCERSLVSVHVDDIWEGRTGCCGTHRCQAAMHEAGFDEETSARCRP